MPPDPIHLELFRNLFEAAAEEMGITLQRVAFSANIKERRDFSCALYDSTGELLAQAAHIPVHLGSMPAAVPAVLDRLGPMDEGDVAIVNDPFAGGAGRFRGGDGMIRSIEALADCTGTLLADRRKTAPYGLAGGSAGAAGRDAIGATPLLRGKTPVTLRRGDILTLQTPGGGGWGGSPAIEDTP